MGDLGDSLDLPFEESPSGQMPDIAEALFSGGLVVMALAVDVPAVGKNPALAFRFATPTGGFYQPIVLVTDDDQLAKLQPLIIEAVQTARRAAKRYQS